MASRKRSVLAFRCNHVIRYCDTDFSLSELDIDNNVMYCNAYELERAERLFDTEFHWIGVLGLNKDNKYYEARQRLIRAKIDVANDSLSQEQQGTTDSPANSATASKADGRHVCFGDDQAHRPETETCSRKSFQRRSPSYIPGAHADRTGNGFENTCNPESMVSTTTQSTLVSYRFQPINDDDHPMYLASQHVTENASAGPSESSTPRILPTALLPLSSPETPAEAVLRCARGCKGGETALQTDSHGDIMLLKETDALP